MSHCLECANFPSLLFNHNHGILFWPNSWGYFSWYRNTHLISLHCVSIQFMVVSRKTFFASFLSTAFKCWVLTGINYHMENEWPDKNGTFSNNFVHECYYSAVMLSDLQISAPAEVIAFCLHCLKSLCIVIVSNGRKSDAMWPWYLL